MSGRSRGTERETGGRPLVREAGDSVGMSAEMMIRLGPD